MTAAHKTLPFGTKVRVTHSHSGRSVDVVINDRGPYIAGRIIDLSRAAASVIGMTAQGIAKVTVQILGR
jgi:rare lipoprotein A